MVVVNGLSDLSILVTGGAGFIGSHVVDMLTEMENEVTIFDNLSPGCMRSLEHHLDDTNFRLI